MVSTQHVPPLTRAFLAALVVALALAAPSRAGIQFVQRPTYVDLGALQNGRPTFAQGISASGQVVGWGSLLDGPSLIQHGFYWSPAAGMRDLGTPPGGGNSQAAAINAHNQIAGFAEFDRQPHAVLWQINDGGTISSLRDLGLLPGGRTSAATGVNNLGQVVGSADTEVDGRQVDRAFFWSAATGMVDLGTLGGESSGAEGINDAGQVVGLADTAAGEPSGFVFQVNADGTVASRQSLALPPDRVSPPITYEFTDATAINAAGVPVGYAQAVLGPTGGRFKQLRPVRWPSPAGPAVDLGVLPGGTGFAHQAKAINGPGQVVGVGNTGSGNSQRAFFWSSAAGMRDLSLVLGRNFLEVVDATGINDAQQVAATGILNVGPAHALLLNVCPQDVTGWPRVTLGPVSTDPRTGRAVQTVTLANPSRTPLQGPVRLALDNLSPGVTLANAAGATTCAAPLGRPYVTVDVGSSGALRPLATARATLVFVNPGRRRITYQPRVLAGGIVP